MTEQNPQSAIVMADSNGVITAWNTTASEFFGFASDHMLGQRLDAIIPPDYRAAHWAAFDRAMQTGICQSDRAAFHLPVLRSDGTAGIFPARFLFLLDAFGNAAGAAVVLSAAVEAEPFSAVSK